MQKRFSFPSLTLVLAFLCSCGKQEPPREAIRSIKYIKVEKRATGQIRKFPGVVYASDYANISFEDIGGKVESVNVDIGQKVKKGQVLATMDREKFELDVKNAQAALKKAEASLVKANADYEREQVLFKKQVSYKQRLDTMKNHFEAAKSNLEAAKANLGLSERNLRNTELKAPYNGYIGERDIEPNQIVKVGQKIFRVDAEGKLEAHFDIPENLRKRVTLGMKGTATFSSLPNASAKCDISYLGTSAGQGNSFPVKAVLIDPPNSVKPGMTAEITLSLSVESKDYSGFLIPPQAVLPGKAPKTGYVFIYDPKTSTVHKVKVSAKGAQNNFGIIEEGLKEGDIVATAGVSFLADGMKVKLFKPSQYSDAK